MQATRKSDGKSIQFYSASALDSGDVVVASNIVGVIVNDLTAADITAGREATADVTGCFTFPKASGAVTQGDLMYWDVDGTPVGGSTTGAMTNLGDGSNPPCGFAADDAAGLDATVDVILQPLAGVAGS